MYCPSFYTVKTDSPSFNKHPTRFVVVKKDSMNINNNPILCGSRNKISELPQYSKRALRRRARFANRQTDFPNLHKPSTTIAADKTDSLKLRKHSTSISADKTVSFNKYCCKQNRISDHLQASCGRQNGLFELLEGCNMLCSRQNRLFKPLEGCDMLCSKQNGRSKILQAPNTLFGSHIGLSKLLQHPTRFAIHER